MKKVMKIYCEGCDQVIRVYGKIWEHRLRYAHQDEKGNYLGWNCDSCADTIESGGY